MCCSVSSFLLYDHFSCDIIICTRILTFVDRYRNIWPFEHARVRLLRTKPGEDDYMNASYVQPLGTTKRYIATQGPLPATYADFWTYVVNPCVNSSE